MKVSSNGIVNGFIEDRFGAKGEQFAENGMPNYSLPLEITDAPSATESYVIIMEDRDAVPVSGFSFIHWLVANVKHSTLEENESVLNKELVQGVNSYCNAMSKIKPEDAIGYGGPDPPNKPHEYEIRVYALDTMLMLKNGFMLNDLYRAMRSRVLAKAVIYGTYAPKE